MAFSQICPATTDILSLHKLMNAIQLINTRSLHLKQVRGWYGLPGTGILRYKIKNKLAFVNICFAFKYMLVSMKSL